MCKSKRKLMLDFFFSSLYLGVDFFEEIVTQKSDHFVDNFKFNNQEKLKKLLVHIGTAKAICFNYFFWGAG